MSIALPSLPAWSRPTMIPAVLRDIKALQCPMGRTLVASVEYKEGLWIFACKNNMYKQLLFMAILCLSIHDTIAPFTHTCLYW